MLQSCSSYRLFVSRSCNRRTPRTVPHLLHTQLPHTPSSAFSCYVKERSDFWAELGLEEMAEAVSNDSMRGTSGTRNSGCDSEACPLLPIAILDDVRSTSLVSVPFPVRSAPHGHFFGPYLSILSQPTPSPSNAANTVTCLGGQTQVLGVQLPRTLEGRRSSPFWV